MNILNDKIESIEIHNTSCLTEAESRTGDLNAFSRADSQDKRLLAKFVFLHTLGYFVNPGETLDHYITRYSYLFNK